jgi:hypothetical protein
MTTTSRERRIDANAIVTDPEAYLARRTAERDRMIPLRRTRRVRLGDRVVLEFENAETLQYQVQEMVFAEHVTDPAEVQHEVDAYGRLLPSSHELCATFLIELEDLDTVREELTRLAGLQHALSIRLDSGEEALVAPGVELPGVDEDGPNPDTVSVHFVRFRFDDATRDAFRDPEQPAYLVADHPEYAADTPISGDTRLALLADLSMGDGAA